MDFVFIALAIVLIGAIIIVLGNDWCYWPEDNEDEQFNDFDNVDDVDDDEQ